MVSDAYSGDPLGLGTVLRRTDDWLGTEVGGAILIMHATTGRFVGLNETASEIWKLLEAPRTLEEIGIGLADEFEITPEKAIADMTEFVAQMIKDGAIDVTRPGP